MKPTPFVAKMVRKELYGHNQFPSVWGLTLKLACHTPFNTKGFCEHYGLPEDLFMDDTPCDVQARVERWIETGETELTLILKVGHRYRTREGDTVIIIIRRRDHLYYPYQAANGDTYTETGDFYVDEESSRDLVEDLGPHTSGWTAVTPELEIRHFDDYPEDSDYELVLEGKRYARNP